jgi:sec-independent protein translocase protein TatA
MPMGGVELLAILAILLLFFGAKRVPQLAKSLGTGARELKKAASEEAEEGEKKAGSEGTDGGGAKAATGGANESTKAAPEGADGGKPKPGAASKDSLSERDGARVEGREPREN